MTWNSDASEFLLRLIWEAYDSLIQDVLVQIDITKADGDLERSLTQLLEPRIGRLMTGDEPFYVQHGTYEHESRAVAPAQPPQYDIALVLNANPRIMWPAEAKVLRTSSSVAEYVTELKANYLTCRYAPFSREAAMLGYLVKGDQLEALRQLSNKIPCKMLRHPAFKDRPHRYSAHVRKVPKDKNFYRRFRCHHLIMKLSDASTRRSGN